MAFVKKKKLAPLSHVYNHYEPYINACSQCYMILQVSI